MPAELCTYRHATSASHERARRGVRSWPRWIGSIALVTILTSLPAALGAHGEKEKDKDGRPQKGGAVQQPAQTDPWPLADVEGGEETSSPLNLAAIGSHIRVADYRLRTILERAAESSATLHELVMRLQTSDVVAYVEYDMRQHSRLAGHLSFVSSAAGLRYVRISVAYLGVPTTQASVVGHELRHAVEVAELPTIVDVNSLEHEFRRIGFENGAGGSMGARSFETRAAQDTGDRILRELKQSTD